MRRVLRNSSEVFHVWAQQKQPYGECGNVHFHGGILFSYQAEIGNIVNPDTVLVAGRRWSVTTSRHISGAISATSHFPIRIMVYNPVPVDVLDHRVNLDKMRGDLETALISEKRARKLHSKEQWSEQAESILRGFTAYVTLFKLKRIAHAEYRNIGEMDADKLTRDRKVAEKVRAAEKKRETYFRRVREVELYREWKRGESQSYYAPSLNFTALRLSSDGAEIETSKGVKIRVRLAARLWAAILAARAAQAELKPNIQIDYYKVDSIKPNGTLVAGCHTIPFFESRMIANALGLPMEVGTI